MDMSHMNTRRVTRGAITLSMILTGGWACADSANSARLATWVNGSLVARS